MTPKIQMYRYTYSEHAIAVHWRFRGIVQDKLPDIAHGMGISRYQGIILGASFYYLPRYGNGNNGYVRKMGYIPLANVRFFKDEEEMIDPFIPGFGERNIRILRHHPLRLPKKADGVNFHCHVISNNDIREMEVWMEAA